MVSIVERQHGQSRDLAVPRMRLVLGFFVFQALIGLPGQGLGGRAALGRADLPDRYCLSVALGRVQRGKVARREPTRFHPARLPIQFGRGFGHDVGPHRRVLPGLDRHTHGPPQLIVRR